MTTITQTITDIAPAANPSTMTRAVFSSTAAANVLAIVNMTAELNTWATQANAMAAAMSAIATGSALSIPLTFSTTTTDSDPGNGILRLDNATQNAATTIRTDLIGNDGSTWTDVIALFDDSTSTVKGFITLVDLDTPTNWLVFSVASLATPSGYVNITVTNVASSATNPFADAASLALQFTRNGDKGDTGPAGTLSGNAGGNIDMLTYQLTLSEVKDTVYTISDGAAFEIDPANGAIQIVTLGDNRTPAATNFEAGQAVLLGVDDGTAYAITWTTVSPTWVTPGGTASAPTLATSGYTWILLWKVASTIYGVEVGQP